MKTKHLLIFLENIGKVTNVNELHKAVADVCLESGYDNFIYGARLPTSFTKPGYVYVSGYPDEWRTRYVNRRYLGTDPTVLYCANNIIPKCWADISDASIENSDPIIMLEAREFGLRSGISAPLHTPKGEFAMLSFSSARDSELTKSYADELMPEIGLLLPHLHEAVLKLVEAPVRTSKQWSLTTREQECLLWAADGKSSWETSQILKVSERTVIFHLQNVAQKLGVTNRSHAVARAISLGLISPQFE